MKLRHIILMGSAAMAVGVALCDPQLYVALFQAFYDFPTMGWRDWIDLHAQWWVLKVVYPSHWWLLPVVAAILLLRPRHPWGPVWRWLLIIPGVFYLAWFQMHHYSRLGWPLMASVLLFLCLIGYASFPREWAEAIAALLRNRLVWRAWFQWFLRLLLPLLILLTLALWAAVPVFYWWGTSHVRTAWWHLCWVVPAILALGYLLKSLKGGEASFSAYLEADPRMVCYLDCVRAIRSPNGKADAGILAKNKNRLLDLPGDDGLAKLKPTKQSWTRWFQRASSGWTLLILRLLARQGWMPTLRSRFVMERLEAAREKAWNDYEKSRYGETFDEYWKALRPPGADDDWRPTWPLPAEVSQESRFKRLKWLALTEALAECYAFSDPSEATGDPQPDMLRATALLSEAGELQHEIVRDLERQGANAAANTPQDRQLAIHYFSLSTHCLELYIEPHQPQPAQEDLPQRLEQFCGPLKAAGWWEAHSDQFKAKVEPSVIESHRLTLFYRYLLLGRLQARDSNEMKEWLRKIAEPLESVVRGSFSGHSEGWPIETYFALAAYYVDLRRGDLAGGCLSETFSDDSQQDPLARLESFVEKQHEVHAAANASGKTPWPGSWLIKLFQALRGLRQAFTAIFYRPSEWKTPLRPGEDDPETQAIKAKERQRLSFLWGLAAEQDLDHVPGAAGWERCRQAAGLYSYAQSIRIWRLAGASQAQDSPLAHPDREITELVWSGKKTGEHRL